MHETNQIVEVLRGDELALQQVRLALALCANGACGRLTVKKVNSHHRRKVRLK
jgi:hypothetical protein